MSERTKHELAIELNEIDAVERVDTDKHAIEVVMMESVLDDDLIDADVYDSIMAVIEPSEYVADGKFNREYFERHTSLPRKGEIVLRYAESRF